MNLNQITSQINQKRIIAIIGSVLYSSSGGGGSSVWGAITGTLSNQTDLQNALNAKLNVASPSYTGTLSTGTLGYSDINILAALVSNVNNYNQVILQNTSNGNTASTNWNVSNDQGTSTTNFGEFGINSSAYTGSSIFSQAGYVYVASASTDLVIGTYGNKPIHFVVNSGSSDAFTINANGTSTFGSSFLVNGIGGNGYGEFIAQSSNASAPSNTGLRIFGSSTGALNWVRKNGSDTYVRSFESTLTANRTWTFLDRSGTVSDLYIQRATGISNNRYATSPTSIYLPTTTAASANTLVAIPIIFNQIVSIDTIITEITTGTSGNYRIGIYMDDGTGYPNSLLLDSGQIVVTTPQINSISVSLSLNPGIYWLAYLTDTANTYRALPSNVLPNILGRVATLGNNSAGSGWQIALSYTSLPSIFTAGATVRNNQPTPEIALRLI